MINEKILDILLCSCHNGYVLEKEKLVCSACGSKIPIEDGIVKFPLISDSQRDEVIKRDVQAARWSVALTDKYEKWKDLSHTVEINAVIKSLDLQHNDIVVDVGAGAGRIIKEIYQDCGFVIAIDFSVECLRVLLEITKGSDKVIAIRGNAAELNFKAATVDKIICTQVIQHIKRKVELDDTIESLSKVLNNNGRAIFTVYNYGYDKKHAGFEKDGYWFRNGEEPLYRHFYSKVELQVLLEQFFEIENITGIDNRLPLNLVGRMGGFAFFANKMISRTPLGFAFGNFLG